jgi:voltage-gated potassium channel
MADEIDRTPGPRISRRVPGARAWFRFLKDPSSVRRALRVIIAANLTVVVAGGLLIWLLDPKDYPNVGLAFWYILQTVTTVGYGDATPTEPLGRLVGAIVMLTAIGFLSILTASITSAFVDARQAARRAPVDLVEAEHRERLEARLDELFVRLAAIERQGGDDRRS